MGNFIMIGIFGGTFDPIHFGHLSLAMDMLDKHQLEEVWFCPVGISPHKQESPPTAVEHRLKMLQIALEDIYEFKILDVETKRQGPSFTIDTLRDLFASERKQQQPREFCLILGDDALQNFCNWHQPEEIVKLVPVFIGRRALEPFKLEDAKMHPAVLKALTAGLTETRIMEISATEIRKRIAEGQYCGHLLPAKVLDYIYDNKLYLRT
jgi:nicotinate-nucleotide adenylyltransferase